METKLKNYFESYPGASRVYSTSDSFLFQKQGDANVHAKGLKDKTVSCHLRAAPLIIPAAEDEHSEFEAAAELNETSDEMQSDEKDAETQSAEITAEADKPKNNKRKNGATGN